MLAAGTRFAHWYVTEKIGFPGWPEPILDSVTGLGRQLRKGGLHQPPFSFSGVSSQCVACLRPRRSDWPRILHLPKRFPTQVSSGPLRLNANGNQARVCKWAVVFCRKIKM